MTITPAPSIKNSCFMVRDKAVLTRVPENIIVTPTNSKAAFIGASSKTSCSSHDFYLGILEYCVPCFMTTNREYKFEYLFRFNLWWMIPCFGESGSEVPAETQMLLLEISEPTTTAGERFYLLLLPILDGQFRASLQGANENRLEFSVGSGDPNVLTSQVFESVFISSGDNPFKRIKNSIKILEKQKGTFSHIENKKIPEHVMFGWSTWDAFYTGVSPQRIEEGLKSYIYMKLETCQP
nr:probable galactinol--sucrose galactosyltransferase 2 [Ziziphus jujuba var. spinosa]